MRKTAFITMFTSLLISISFLMFNVQPIRASETIYIRADGSIDPDTAPISTLDNVTYILENNISEPIGIERNNIIVYGANYIIQGTGSGIGSGTGISLSGRNNVTIINMEIKNHYVGIYLTYSTNINITQNSITNNTYGLRLSDSSNNNMIRNNITANSVYGINLDVSANNTFRENDMDNNKNNFGVYGTILSHYIQNVDSTNTVNGKPIYYWINRHDMTAPPDAGYLALVNCTHMTVNNLSITNSGQGLLIVNTNNSIITNNNITKNHHGIQLRSSSNNTISQNNIVDNLVGGIRLHNSSDNTIMENHLEENMFDPGISVSNSLNNVISSNNITKTSGINLHKSSKTTIAENNLINNHMGSVLLQSPNNTITGNNMIDNDGGLDLEESSGNIISGNNITNSKTLGIQLWESNNNIVAGNTIAGNWEGLGLAYCENNTIYHNNFANIFRQAFCYWSTSFWDNDYEGNYWSDYKGLDIGYNGIGDTPYIIDENNTDNYPLMGMFYSFNVSLPPHPSGGSEYVNVISNSTVEHLRLVVFVSLPNQNSTTDQEFLMCYVEGENETGGFCRVMIPKTVLNSSSYTVSVNHNPVDVKELQDSNSTHAYIYFTYQHSRLEVKIFPEFPSLLILPLYMMATLLAVTVYRREQRTKLHT